MSCVSCILTPSVSFLQPCYDLREVATVSLGISLPFSDDVHEGFGSASQNHDVAHP